MKILNAIKNLVIYDADREFYAQVFPESVEKIDLMRIRKMFLSDLNSVLAIEAKNYNYPWGREIFKDCFIAPSYSCWVCEDTENIVAYAILSVAAGEAHVLNLSVDPASQGLGVGKLFMQHLIKQARKKSETIFLEVRPSNLNAISLYKSLGFNEIGVRKDYYPTESGREDAVMLALELVSLF